MIALSLGFWFFCFIFIHLTFKANSAFTRWFLILMPLYAFYPLAIFPMNSPITMIVWLPVTICFIVSFIMLIGRIIDYAVGGRGPYYKQKLVRPILMILVFIGAFTYHHASENKAIAYTIDLAKQIQYQCDQTGKCPELIDGWHKDINRFLGNTNETATYKPEIK